MIYGNGLFKACSKCHVGKLLCYFYKNKAMKDGYSNQCIGCSEISAYKTYQKNKDKKSAYGKKYYQEKKDVIKKTHANYYHNNREWFREQNARWARENPEQHAARGHRYRARKRGIGPSHWSGSEWKKVLSTYGKVCLACGDPSKKVTADHVIPLVKGGDNLIQNIQPLCKPCNSRKHTNTIDYRPDKGASLTTHPYPTDLG